MKMGKETCECNQELINFLLYSYFGIVPHDGTNSGDNKEEIAIKCAKRAYLDLARTLNYSISTTELDKHKKKYTEYIKTKEDFINIISDDICKCILKMLNENGKNFDAWHTNLCKDIINKAANQSEEKPQLFSEPLAFGQAQKWVNMTLKYMMLLGLVNDNVSSMLHIPVDSYIMQAARNKFEIGLVKKGRKSKGKYTDSSLKWSQWNEQEYIDFQTQLKAAITEVSPIDWEGPAWIEQSEKLKHPKSNKLE